MDISHVAPELRKPMRLVTLIPLPTTPGARLRLVRRYAFIVLRCDDSQRRCSGFTGVG